MMSLSNVLLVAAGGAMGASLRFLLSTWLMSESARFPWATLTANLSGALFAGAAFTWFWQRDLLGTPVQLALVVGLLGGFTTFSAFSVETLRLIEANQPLIAGFNIAGNVIGSLVAVWAGAALVRYCA